MKFSIRIDPSCRQLSKFTIEAELTTEMRYLGIYEVPVYTAQVKIQGLMDLQKLRSLQPDGDILFWLPLGDVQGRKHQGRGDLAFIVSCIPRSALFISSCFLEI